MDKSIDRGYFEQYAGSKQNYSDVYRDYSRIEECIDLFPNPNEVSNICVLGSACGNVLADLHHKFNLMPAACEINTWAYSQTPSKFKDYVCLQDMREFILQQTVEKNIFDLAFTNSLVYLDESELDDFLATLAECCRKVHFQSSFLGDSCRDSYRKTLRTHAWWNKKFQKAGFRLKKNARGNERYLWINQIL